MFPSSEGTEVKTYPLTAFIPSFNAHPSYVLKTLKRKKRPVDHHGSTGPKPKTHRARNCHALAPPAITGVQSFLRHVEEPPYPHPSLAHLQMFPIPRLITLLKNYFQISVQTQSSRLLVPPMILLIQAVGSPPSSPLDRIMADNLVLLAISYSALTHSGYTFYDSPLATATSRKTQVRVSKPAPLLVPSIQTANCQWTSLPLPHSTNMLVRHGLTAHQQPPWLCATPTNPHKPVWVAWEYYIVSDISSDAEKQELQGVPIQQSESELRYGNGRRQSLSNGGHDNRHHAGGHDNRHQASGNSRSPSRDRPAVATCTKCHLRHRDPVCPIFHTCKQAGHYSNKCPRNGSATSFETAMVEFYVADCIPNDCAVLFGFDQMKANLIDTTWDRTHQPPLFQLLLPRTSYPVGFLVPRSPEAIANIDTPRVYGPQIPEKPPEYDFLHLERLCKILNKSPEELALLCSLYNEAAFNKNNKKSINEVVVKLKLK
ncbi:hypothetical protein SARC_07178 [Sphaeroforma arctica JP610]|uniref:Uncharacterized protein n=1 Tax=Sphaeroforma arctica JP610 TaxID=667725 RepID=A0A0L0FUF6_9EUKA|nr:hypothetical protein SARC_07178 [Sphaeroforma arctica JP610]KNC80462.1 hypothetical protein SARC_07178 [Sphaeroforma arctica JP610]|eukprot:XP_014154364.1 hypothetical protein SARC_07178 [Sphaeroforma arctica JP610]